MRRLRDRVGRAVEAFLHADTPDGDMIDGRSGADFDGWASLSARRARYALAWGLYQNTAFRDLHSLARQLKEDLGLYAHVRNIYNPTDRVVEFAASYIYGGDWDDEAGDGRAVPSAAPIVGPKATPALRRGIARAWRDSLWSLKAEAWTRNGALFGDSPAKVVADLARGKMLFEVIHPKHFKHVDFDGAGHVKAYVIERRRPDPRAGRPAPGEPAKRPAVVTYEEHCWRDGDDVRFATYLIDEAGRPRPWDWTRAADDQGRGEPEWSAPYGFVPLVWTQHIDAGLDFGLAEWHTSRPKLVELDDQASKLHDQIRKVVEPKWLFSGMRRPAVDQEGKSKLDIGTHRGGRDHDEADRDEEGAIYSRNADAKAAPLVAPLPIDDALAVVVRLVEEVERGFPELRFDRLRAGGEVSGEALRVARQPVERKVGRRRARYDTDLVRLHQMALAIGGYVYRDTGDERFADFAPFDLDSYGRGDLDHQIGPRPVFGDDPFEQAALRTAVYDGVARAVAAGIPKRVALREAGYTDDQVDEMDALAEQDAARAMERARAFRVAAGDDDDSPDQRDDVPPGGDER